MAVYGRPIRDRQTTMSATPTKNATSRAAILKRAADYLDDGAQCCFNGGTVRGKWVKGDAYTEAMKREHYEQRELAKALRAMARAKR